jgi:hypothetical protein
LSTPLNHSRSAGTWLTGTSVVGACTCLAVVQPPLAAACAWSGLGSGLGLGLGLGLAAACASVVSMAHAQSPADSSGSVERCTTPIPLARGVHSTARSACACAAGPRGACTVHATHCTCHCTCHCCTCHCHRMHVHARLHRYRYRYRCCTWSQLSRTSAGASNESKAAASTRGPGSSGTACPCQ